MIGKRTPNGCSFSTVLAGPNTPTWISRALPFLSLIPRIIHKRNLPKLRPTQYSFNSIRRLLSAISPKKIHQRLQDLASSNSLTSHLCIALRTIGTKKSIPMLIKFLQRDSKDSEAEWQANMQTGVMEMAVTSALWKLNGRKHVFTQSQWNAWWQSVEPDFTVQRDRELPEHQTFVTAARVKRLITLLTTDEEAAQERLISLGSAALPYLLTELSAELSKSPMSVSAEENSNTSPRLIRLAWVIDELGATEKLPSGLRQKYFTQRFANANNDPSFLPLFEDAVCRALTHCSFADFCSICLETAVLRDDQFQQVSRLGLCSVRPGRYGRSRCVLPLSQRSRVPASVRLLSESVNRNAW